MSDRPRLPGQPTPIPDALAALPTIRARIEAGHPVLFLDFDGTLTPIRDQPEQAELSAQGRATLTRLAECMPVAIVSGRGLTDLVTRVGIDGLSYAGSHGFEIQFARGDETLHYEVGQEYLLDIEAAETELRDRLADVAGCRIERKRYTLAIHYRHCSRVSARQVRQTVEAFTGARPRLTHIRGKMVVEVRPDIAWHKGNAVQWVLQRAGDATRLPLVPIYIGDDTTDEDALRTLPAHGIGIRVSATAHRRTAAGWRLRDPQAVWMFLDGLADDCESGTDDDPSRTSAQTRA